MVNIISTEQYQGTTIQGTTIQDGDICDEKWQPGDLILYPIC